MRSRNFALIGAAALAVSLSALPASAHHGWGGQATSFSDMTGTVVQGVSLAGPHATMKVTAADGQVWDVVLAPGGRTQAAGLKEGIIPVGAKVMLHGHRHLTATKYEIKTERVTWNNRVFNVYPDRN